MAEENLVVVVLKGVGKCKREVTRSVFAYFSFELIRKVCNILTDSVPTNTLRLFQFVRKAEHFHAIVVKRVWLCQIKHIKLDFLTLPRVPNSEEIPLSVSIRVYIVLQNQIILAFRHFCSCE